MKVNIRVKKILFTTISVIAVFLVFAYIKSLDFQIHADKIVKMEFQNGSDTLSGSLYLPKGDEPFSVVIFLHGDGPVNRDANGVYNMYFNAFLDKGIACFSYDKPGIGQSTGNWLSQTMSERAKEAQQARHFLNSSINANKIGFIGFSQGGWVVSELALLNSNADFMIVVSGAIDWMDQGKYMEKIKLANMNITEDEIRVYKIHSERIDTLIKEGDYNNYIAYIKQVSRINDSLNEPPIEKDRFNFAHLNMNANASEGIKEILCPFLGIFGEKDCHVNAVESVETYSSIFKTLGKEDYEICMFKDATHELLKHEYKPLARGDFSGLFFKAFLKGKEIFATGFLEKLGDWVLSLK